MEKNFVAKIMANISNFERNVRKAQRQAQDIPKETETKIKGDVSDFQRAIQKAKALAQRFRKHNVKFDADTGEVITKITMLKAMANKLKFKVNFDTRGMTKGQVAMKAMAQQIDNFQGEIDSLANRIRSFGTVFSQTFKGVMLTSVQGLIPVIAGIVPALFSVLNAAKAVSGGIVAIAGAGAIGFGGIASYALMATSAIKMLSDGTLEASKQSRAYESALKGVKSQWAEIVKMNASHIFQSMANGLNAVKSGMRSLIPFFSGVAKGMDKASASLLKWTQTSAVAKKFFNMLNTTGVSVFNKLLSAAGHFGDGLVNVFTQLAPLFQWSANWLDRLGASFQKWANSAAGQNSIKQFMEYTKTNLPIIGNIFKNVFAGIFNLMKAFGSNSTTMFEYLEKMSSKFREWSETVGNSQGFKNFVSYMQENGPVIMQLIGNIVRALVAFGTAMAPIASAILKVVTQIVGFTASLMENHPWIARVAGIAIMLMGALWALAVPLIAVNNVLGLFGGSLIKLVGKFASVMGASKIFTGVMNVLKGAFSLLMSPLTKLPALLELLGTAFTVLTGPVGIVIAVIAALVGAIVWLWKTNEGFRNMIIEAWNNISSAIGTAIQGVITWLTTLWDNIMSTLQPIMPILEWLGQLFMQSLGNMVALAVAIAIGAFQTLWTVVSVVFQTIGMVISVFVQLVVGLFTALAQILTGDFSGAWQTMQNTITNVNNTISSYLQSVWGTIKEFLSNIWGTIKNLFTAFWDNMSSTAQNKAQQIWSTIANKFQEIAGTIRDKVSQWVNNVKNGFMNMVSSAVSGMASFLGKIVSGFYRVVGAVKNGVSNAVSAARGFIGEFASAGLSLIQSLASGIANGVSHVVGAVKNVVGSAISAAKSLVGGSGGQGSGGMGSAIAASISGGQGAAVSAASALSKAVNDKLNSSINTDLVSGNSANFSGTRDNIITGDVQHRLTESNRPVVNVNVHNESDIPAIKSWIDDQNSRNSALIL